MHPRPGPEPNPQLIWDNLNAHQRSSALRAAIELDIFTGIGEGITMASGLAERAGVPVRGMRILCDYLTVNELLTRSGSEYGLTPTSGAFLDTRSPACMASMVKFLHSPKLLEGFRDLTAVVRNGGTMLPHGGMADVDLDEWVTFAEAMKPIVASSAEFIAELVVDEGQPRRVLDIAAGHGLFGMSVARRAPEARIAAMDFAKVLAITEKNAREAGLGDRFEFIAGDIFTGDPGKGYDVALVTNLLHHFDEAGCIQILRKVASALEPRGTLYILEFVPNADRVSPPIPAMFSMMMLGLTPAGDAYTLDELSRMLREAGFGEPAIRDVPRSPQQVLISRKAA